MQLYFRTDVGLVRETNQDACKLGKISDTEAWAAVCDGMGGANGGSVASTEAVEEIGRYIEQEYRSDMTEDELAEVAELAVDSANTKVYEMACANPELEGMGTTVELAFVRGEKVFVVHAGDSRVYLASCDTIIQVTHDHSLVQQMVDIGEITPEEARVHPRRNYITRALGIDPELWTDILEKPFEKGSILVLCSDGLTNYIEQEELLEVIKATQTDKLADTLVEIALERGGGDNVTVAVVVND